MDKSALIASYIFVFLAGSSTDAFVHDSVLWRGVTAVLFVIAAAGSIWQLTHSKKSI